MSFQRQVNVTPAPAVAGDFASANPRASVLAGPNGLIAGAAGVTVGRFAWIDDIDGITVYNSGRFSGAPSGFVHREQQALITNYLAEAGNAVPVGFPVTLHNQGDFFATVTGATAATVGAAIYATYADGNITIGSAATGASVTASSGSTTTAAVGATFTATGSGTNLTTSAQTGYISVGDTISGTGIPAGTTIVSQTSGTTGAAGVYVTSQATTISAATGLAFGTNLIVSAATGYISVGDHVAGTGITAGSTIAAQLSGTAGSTGTYQLSAPTASYVASGTITTYGNVLNVTAVGSGALSVGDPITGTGIPAGAVISGILFGSGGVGRYTFDVAATAYAASTTVTVVAGVLTSFKAASAAAVGELVKITSWS